MKIDSKYMEFLKSLLGVAVILGVIFIGVGDQRWMTVEASEQLFVKMEKNSLDRQITFLQIKINEGEATRSERIYIEALRQQLRALENGDF